MMRIALALNVLLAAALACQQPVHQQVSGGDVVAVDLTLSRDTSVAAAARALAAGHPWRATLLLLPVLRDSSRATPDVVLLAARAASAWEGWEEVQQLLATAPWLDTQAHGEGHELLARAALATGADSAATAHASAAVAQAAGDSLRGVRLVLLARALDRRNVRDSAATAYRQAADRLVPAREWLLLRAAGVTDDSAARAALYASVSRAPVRARVPWTEAQALERAGAVEAASQRFAALGARASSFRLRFAMPSDSAARQRLREEIVAFVAANPGTSEARQSVEVLDKYVGAALTPAEERVIARALATGGPPARAVAAYGRADSLTTSDRLQYGQLLIRAGRYRDAIAQLERVTSGSEAGDAAYQRARALLLAGSAADARTALNEAVSRFPNDTAAASAALMLAADLAVDDHDESQAGALYLRAAREYPTSTRADDARFQAGIIAYTRADYRAAAALFDTLVTRYPRSPEVLAARYWAGRALERVGSREAARTRWRSAIAADPLSYYAGRSARRLGETVFAPGAAAAAYPRLADVDSAAARIRLLDRLDMDVESRFEAEALEDAASTSVDRLLATGQAMQQLGLSSRAIRLGRAAVQRNVRDRRAYRLAYPLIARETIVDASRRRGLDPAFVAGLIRQESSFNDHAVSPAGARGLMQVMPSVGATIARNARWPLWDASLLFEPEANIELGTAHLADALRHQDSPMRALAAYNAGDSRVARWRTRAGADDPELFAERIPFVETRDYVRIVTRNAEIYRALYGW